jgi:preprotein translocase subunit YajC
MPVALLYFLFIGVAFYVFLVRPQRRQVAAHRALVATLEVGDEVITSGGVFGTIRGIEDAAVDLEVASGVVLRVARGAIAQRVTPEIDESSPAGDDGDAERPTD